MKAAIQYKARQGSPYTDEQMKIIGPELQKIADQHRVSDIRSLDAKLVAGIVSKDKHHPLRAFWTKNVADAASFWWVEQTRKMIGAVQVYTVSAGTRPEYKPMFVSAEAPTSSGAYRRTMVVRSDALTNDVVFMSGVAGQIRRVISAVEAFENFSSDGSPPPEVERFRTGLRKVIDAYLASVASDKAAE
jgi:hypothetical protein